MDMADHREEGGGERLEFHVYLKCALALTCCHEFASHESNN